MDNYFEDVMLGNIQVVITEDGTMYGIDNDGYMYWFDENSLIFEKTLMQINISSQ